MVSEWAGHNSVAFTLTRYGGLFEDGSAEAVDRLEALLYEPGHRLGAAAVGIQVEYGQSSLVHPGVSRGRGARAELCSAARRSRSGAGLSTGVAGRAGPIIKKALELGINFFDTANVYSIGMSEEILGRALRDFADRDEVVIATKLRGRMRAGPNGAGLSRKAILSEIDHSLQRLGTEYVDLYQIHRWDYQTSIEETMEALHDVVKAGKVRYTGASAMFAWQFQKALHVAEKNGWTRFVSMQDHLNLIYREEEREMLPLCREEKIGVIPYSPLASGRLTRDWSSESTLRSETDQIARTKYDATADTDR